MIISQSNLRNTYPNISYQFSTVRSSNSYSEMISITDLYAANAKLVTFFHPNSLYYFSVQEKDFKSEHFYVTPNLSDNITRACLMGKTTSEYPNSYLFPVHHSDIELCNTYVAPSFPHFFYPRFNDRLPYRLHLNDHIYSFNLSPEGIITLSSVIKNRRRLIISSQMLYDVSLRCSFLVLSSKQRLQLAKDIHMFTTINELYDIPQIMYVSPKQSKQFKDAKIFALKQIMLQSLVDLNNDTCANCCHMSKANDSHYCLDCQVSLGGW